MELLKTDKVNLKLLKNQFAFIFTLSICKICMFQSEKKKQSKDYTHHTHSPLHPMHAPVQFWTDPLLPTPPTVPTLWMAPGTYQFLVKHVWNSLILKYAVKM